LSVRLGVATLSLALISPACALDYRSTARPALLYDAPSTAASRVAIAGEGLPLEIVVDTDAWAKVRDPGGRLAWIEKSALDGARTVMIKSEVSDVRREPRANAEVVFRAARGVLLRVTGEVRADGWLPVRHADGLTGWLPAFEVWGQ
jgi:SH3-like domain-containing protein